jgi:hypothetical protein
MKLTTTFLLLPFLASATPIANIMELGWTDKTCTVAAETTCFGKPSSDAMVQLDIPSTEHFGVRCKANGITSAYDWDYIPGWNCWVPSSKTLNGCDGEFSVFE